jgi:hypothetical protein
MTDFNTIKNATVAGLQAVGGFVAENAPVAINKVTELFTKVSGSDFAKRAKKFAHQNQGTLKLVSAGAALVTVAGVTYKIIQTNSGEVEVSTANEDEAKAITDGQEVEAAGDSEEKKQDVVITSVMPSLRYSSPVKNSEKTEIDLRKSASARIGENTADKEVDDKATAKQIKQVEEALKKGIGNIQAVQSMTDGAAKTIEAAGSLRSSVASNDSVVFFGLDNLFDSNTSGIENVDKGENSQVSAASTPTGSLANSTASVASTQNDSSIDNSVTGIVASMKTLSNAASGKVRVKKKKNKPQSMKARIKARSRKHNAEQPKTEQPKSFWQRNKIWMSVTLLPAISYGIYQGIKSIFSGLKGWFGKSN